MSDSESTDDYRYKPDSMEYGEHGRCEATAKSTGERCGRPAINDSGKCEYHGGKSLRGSEHPDFEHGLFADHLSERDREAIEVLEEYDSAQKLEELIDWRLARLRGACRRMNAGEEMSFWDAFEELVNQQESPEAEEIRELAEMLDTGNRAMQEEIDLVRKLISDYDKVADGSAASLRDLFGGGGPSE